MQKFAVFAAMVLTLGVQYGYGYTHTFVNKTENPVSVEMLICNKIDAKWHCAQTCVSVPRVIVIQPGEAGKLSSVCKNQIVYLNCRVRPSSPTAIAPCAKHYSITRTTGKNDAPTWYIMPSFVLQAEQGSGWDIKK